MQRRLRVRSLLLRLLLLSIAITASVPQASAQDASQPIQQMRAFWVDSNNPGFHNYGEVDELVANVTRAGANTLFVQMRRHGDAWYNRSQEPRAAWPALAPAEAFDPLQYLLEKSHAAGVKVHAWLVVGVSCRDRDPLRGHPQHLCTAHGPGVPDPERWTTATYRGQQIGDLDYGHPSAVQHMERLVQELVRAYPDLDGIHYDFIRYTGPEYGYNAVSLDRFNRAYGHPPEYRPAPSDWQWGQWRRDRVTELVRRLYIRIKSVNPRVEVSAATITWGGIGSAPNMWDRSAAYSRVFQDWRAWLEEGIIDFAVPMHYFSEGSNQQRDWYNAWLSWDRWNTGRRAIVVGTGAWLNSDTQGIDQIARAINPDEAGRRLSGVALYSYNQPLSGTNFERRRAFMDQLRSTVFAQPAQAPTWPWVAYPTTGHLQGIATIEGQVVADAHITLYRNGAWTREFTGTGDGWYGVIELEPGQYTVVVKDPARPERNTTFALDIRAGQVTSGP